MPATPAKTIQTAPLAWTDIASGAQSIGASFDCSAKWSAAFAIRLARKVATAFTTAPSVRIEARIAASGAWIPLYTYTMQVGASVAATTLNGAIAANDSTFVVTSATNITVGSLVFLSHSSTANYELVRVKAVSGTTITPEENCVFAHANSAIVSTQAEEVFPSFDVSMYTQIRYVVDDTGSGQDIRAAIDLITMDSF